jgi:hypothetical protein
MAINLSRNTKVYFTTSVTASSGLLKADGISNTNTFEIQVLDGYSFSQGTQQQNIQISEAGDTPARGQRAFNTQLDPVEWSFSTYVRPYIDPSAAGTVACAERLLWNALLGDQIIDTSPAAISALTRNSTTAAAVTLLTASKMVKKFVAGDTGSADIGKEDIINIQGFSGTGVPFNESIRVTANNTSTVTPFTYAAEYLTAPPTSAGTSGTTSASTLAYAGHWARGNTANANYSYVTTLGSNKNTLQKFALIFIVDQVVYAIENCAVDQVTVDFGLDQISTLAWTGKGTKLTEVTTTATTSALLAANLKDNGTAYQAITTANYITNKLSTLKLQSGIGGSEVAGSTSYSIPLTGGNITISNNINYLVPTNLAVVNQPIGYYTGQRSITGSLSAYLRTGDNTDTGGLLKTILAAADKTTEPKYKVQIEMGGAASANRVEFEMGGVVLQVPSVNVADVVAATINFNAQGFDPVFGNNTFDITKNNDLMIRYFSA